MRHFTSLVVIAMLLVTVPAAAEEELWIPAAASNPGFHGTMWTTELWLASRVLDVPITVRAAFFPDQAGTADPVEATIEIAPKTQVEIVDAVATLFGENRAGAIRLRCDHPFLAQSRTANDGGSLGSFGQGIPAFDRAGANDGGTFIGASNHPGNDGVRTNIGIVNVGDESADVLIAARDGQTLDPLGDVFVEIGPNGWYQANLFDLLGVGDQSVGLADIAVWCLEADLLMYLSRIDNRSGDGTFSVPSRKEYVRVEPRSWEVEAILTYTGATVDSFDYTTATGTVSADDPESGFTTGVLNLMSPSTFCTRVVGDRGTGPGYFEVEIRRRPEGEQWGTGRSRHTWTGGASEPIDEEYCVELD